MALNLFDVSERVVVLTGGLGQLGRQFAGALLSAGARVAVVDAVTDEARIKRQFGELALQPNLKFFQADVRERASVESAYEAIKAVWGVPHGLINNAAIDSPPSAPAEENGPFETYPDSSFDLIMDVNVKGVVHCCQVFGGAMAQAGRGSIINVASIYGLVSPRQSIYEYRRANEQPFYKPVAYAASKSALYNVTRYLATYWAGHNVRVNTVTFAGVFNHQDQEFLEAYAPHVPLGRMARDDEYNGTIIYLLSEAASYMTGSNLVVDGGWTAW
jgi:NAD(P)-dependent dehydrogenase (short-subunit alcohol dehydrogenase family)